jgi:type II secretory pathway pseudopilin PulG
LRGDETEVHKHLKNSGLTLSELVIALAISTTLIAAATVTMSRHMKFSSEQKARMSAQNSLMKMAARMQSTVYRKRQGGRFGDYDCTRPPTFPDGAAFCLKDCQDPGLACRTSQFLAGNWRFAPVSTREIAFASGCVTGKTSGIDFGPSRCGIACGSGSVPVVIITTKTTTEAGESQKVQYWPAPPDHLNANTALGGEACLGYLEEREAILATIGIWSYKDGKKSNYTSTTLEIPANPLNTNVEILQ